MKLLRAGRKSSDPSDTISLLRRVIGDQGRRHWRAYALAYLLMGIAAACTAISAYIVGHAINLIYGDGQVWTLVATSFAIMVIFIVRGAASYGQTVVLANINSTIATEYRVQLFARWL